jgi:hypothetical protein
MAVAWVPELSFLREPNIEMPLAVRRVHGLRDDYLWI